ncbi:hypothetical protein [Yinghuangia sp. YIM S10712]|uniref:hypothetical protein n=1 Tax=Yinghuangia sp. YIM S10712 TaxID=3436930 RepID=UPI003F53E3DD
MATRAKTPHPGADATDTARQLASALSALDVEFPDMRPCLLPDGTAGVHLGTNSAAHAARFAERLRERM